jgi:hypothetical protein
MTRKEWAIEKQPRHPAWASTKRGMGTSIRGYTAMGFIVLIFGGIAILRHVFVAPVEHAAPSREEGPREAHRLTARTPPMALGWSCEQKFNWALEHRGWQVCHNREGDEGSCSGQLGQLRAWLHRCIARREVAQGWRVPVYVVSAPRFEFRRKHIKAQLVDAGVGETDIQFRMDFTPDTMKDSSNRNAIYNKTLGGEKGLELPDLHIAIAAEHDRTIGMIAKGDDPWVLVFEDDHFVPKDLLLRLFELRMQAPYVDVFHLNDAWCHMKIGIPPAIARNAAQADSNTYVASVSYYKTYARTVGAYFLSREAARTIYNSRHWRPQFTVVDFQFTEVVEQEKMVSHWAFPPVSCHGSEGWMKSATDHDFDRTTIGDAFKGYCCEAHYELQGPWAAMKSKVDLHWKMASDAPP